MTYKKFRNIAITVFVILWTPLFHYESTRFFYLNPLFKTNLPKTKFLFPPAGWIMFYNVDDAFGHVEVYGVKNGIPQEIDPHEIIRTRTIMYDNIHRNILSSVADKSKAPAFCGFLRRQQRFDYFDSFFVKVIYYPKLSQERFQRFEEIRYRCE